MKELQIIIKRPSDGDPLNLQSEGKPMHGCMTVGYKFQHTDGNMYGDYVFIDESMPEEIVLETIRILVRQAFETEKEL